MVFIDHNIYLTHFKKTVKTLLNSRSNAAQTLFKRCSNTVQTLFMCFSHKTRKALLSTRDRQECLGKALIGNYVIMQQQGYCLSS